MSATDIIGDIHIDADRSFAVYPPHAYTSDIIGYTGKENDVIYSSDFGWIMVTSSGYYSPIFGMIDAVYPHYYTSDLVGYTGKENDVIYSSDYGWVMVTPSGYYSPIFGMIDNTYLRSA